MMPILHTVAETQAISGVTSTAQWNRDLMESVCVVFAVVGVVAALLVLSISALALVLVCLQYTGLICKLKEALPQTLIVSDTHQQLLSSLSSFSVRFSQCLFCILFLYYKPELCTAQHFYLLYK